MLSIARKELATFFASPAAFIFFGAFLAVSLFVVFWVETFFARNIADVRPLFEWMPVLLIFLVAALTMRMWSEERRAGTLEILLTAPVSTLSLVLGKFFACLGLVAIALLLTLPLPITVSFLGELDWGPVFGGYLAALFLAAAYAAIGLYISARNENQIVSLILTTLVGGAFYLLGSDTLTSLFGSRASEFLHLLGSGSRFTSITRGVIDLRDLYYYISVMGIFLTLNVFTLEKLRWAGGAERTGHRKWLLLTVLCVANFAAGNLWLEQVRSVRADITEGHIYSISPATRGYLKQLREPLLIRGYFSAKTHPLLAPLVPQLRDLMREYAIAGGGKVRVEFIDPLEHPDLEQEAGQKYGIRPVAFQTTSKYQAAVVNSYFDILVKYGDQYETLGFRDLIEVKAKSETDIDVELRNPEYDLTRAIKKVLYSYRGGGNLFDNITQPVTFTGYVSADDQLPKQLVTLRQDLQELLDQLKAKAGGKLRVRFVDPDSNNGKIADEIESKYGFQPMTAGLFDTRTFWFYMVLENGQQTVPIPLPESLDAGGIKRDFDAALKRFSSGFLKTIALYTPSPPTSAQRFMMQNNSTLYSMLQDKLEDNARVISTDLADGMVPEASDILVVVAPRTLERKQLFAIDQFLMKGGTIVLATAPFDISMQGALGAVRHTSGLEQWLTNNGIKIDRTMVLDPQNSTFPIPVQRNIGGFAVQEIRMVEYPYFVDIRDTGINRDAGITAGLDQVTMSWASPIHIEEGKNRERRVIKLLESSADSWTSDSLDIQPDFRSNGPLGFRPTGTRGKQLLAAVVEGRFTSFFKGQPSPLLTEKQDQKRAEQKKDSKSKPDKQTTDQKTPFINTTIDKSNEAARIILLASNTFLSDAVLDLAASASRTRYINPLQLVQNAVDWSLEDRGLLAIRSRGHFLRTLKPLNHREQMFWEYLNYGLALFGLLLVYTIQRLRHKQAIQRAQQIVSGGSGNE